MSAEESNDAAAMGGVAMDEEDEWVPPTEAELKVLEARRERSDKISKLMGQYMLKGYKMLASACTTCGTVLLQEKQRDFCVACTEVDNEHTKDDSALSGIAARRQIEEREHRSSSSGAPMEQAQNDQQAPPTPAASFVAPPTPVATFVAPPTTAVASFVAPPTTAVASFVAPPTPVATFVAPPTAAASFVAPPTPSFVAPPDQPTHWNAQAPPSSSSTWPAPNVHEAPPPSFAALAQLVQMIAQATSAASTSTSTAAHAQPPQESNPPPQERKQPPKKRKQPTPDWLDSVLYELVETIRWANKQQRLGRRGLEEIPAAECVQQYVTLIQKCVETMTSLLAADELFAQLDRCLW